MWKNTSHWKWSVFVLKLIYNSFLLNKTNATDLFDLAFQVQWCGIRSLSMPSLIGCKNLQNMYLVVCFALQVVLVCSVVQLLWMIM